MNIYFEYLNEWPSQDIPCFFWFGLLEDKSRAGFQGVSKVGLGGGGGGQFWWDLVWLNHGVWFC